MSDFAQDETGPQPEVWTSRAEIRKQMLAAYDGPQDGRETPSLDDSVDAAARVLADCRYGRVERCSECMTEISKLEADAHKLQFLIHAGESIIAEHRAALRSDPPAGKLWFTKDENPPESGKPHATWVWAVMPRLSDDGRWRATDSSGRAERLEAWSPIDVPPGEVREVTIRPASTGGERDMEDWRPAWRVVEQAEDGTVTIVELDGEMYQRLPRPQVGDPNGKEGE